MEHGFWTQLKRPFVAVAPMADITDPAFRRVLAAYGKPDVMWTEFVSADGLLLADERGKEILQKDLLYSEGERPIVAQLFTADPGRMETAARLVAELGFDGVDINMGCPDRSIERQGCGAALIKNPEQAVALIAAAKRGAGRLPVSVKTRLGYYRDELEEWLPKLLDAEPAAITVHARTRKEMSKVPARWERVGEAVRIRNEHGSSTLIVGNGDVADLEDARKKAAETGADGVMVGRAAIGNPWLFSGKTEVSLAERFAVMLEHAQLFEELLPHKSFTVIRKHVAKYLTGFENAKEVRIDILNAKNTNEIAEVVRRFES